ncbi:MAG: acylneuraminate cytidylyltransferase family protein [Alphaproteobacteria bacterium]|nr:acylneuraminate cytidylyltransferase family protein [Alphaproteobacteria bacterium]
MKRVALIPARGGSKRLPRKNILPFMGKPVIAHTIEAALATGLFERVVVSTEDAEIAEIAEKYGAALSMRDENLATDKAMVKAVAADFLDIEETQGRQYDLLCLLYATAPMRSAQDIEATCALIEPGTCHHALAVCAYEQPPHQALKLTPGTNDLSPMWPELVAQRADSQPVLLVDNGSTYCVMTEDFRKNPGFYAPVMRGHTMPRWKSVDMDTPEDFEIALYFAEKHWGERG